MPTQSRDAAFRSPPGRPPQYRFSEYALISSALLTRYSLRGEPRITSKHELFGKHRDLSDHAFGRKMAQDILQNAAVAVVLKLIESVDTADQWDALEAAVSRDDLGNQPLVRLEITVQPADGDQLVAFQAECLPRGAFLEHQRNNAHAHQIGAMDAFKRLRDHCTHA